jgi:hypothetical protein
MRYLWIVAGLLAADAFAAVLPYPKPQGVLCEPVYEVRLLQGGREIPSPVYTDKARWKTNRCLTTSWSSFATDGPVRVRVKCLNQKIRFCRVLPRRHKINGTVIGDDTAEFEIPGPGQYSVEFEEGIQIHHPLLLFADKYPLEIPGSAGGKVTVFEPGVHDIGDRYELKSGQTVYLKPGSYLRGHFAAEGAQGIKIVGQGILSGEKDGERQNGHMISMRDCRDVLIEGITIINPPQYCVSLGGERHVCRNVKMMGWWFSTDGVLLGGNSLIEDCFFKVNDDALKLYCSGTTVRHCVVWQMENGAPFQISWNMEGLNSVFRVSDVDVIRVEHTWDNPNEAVFDAVHGGGGTMRDYVFEGIRIDHCTHRLLHIATMPNEFAKWDPQKGEIDGLVFRDIECYTVPQKKNIIAGKDPAHPVKNVVFENVRVGNKVWKTAADANLDTNSAYAADVTVRQFPASVSR